MISDRSRENKVEGLVIAQPLPITSESWEDSVWDLRSLSPARKKGVGIAADDV